MSSLVGMLVSLVIMLLLVLVTMGMWGPSVTGKRDPKQQSLPATALDRAEETECQSKLYSARMSASAGGITGDPEQSAPPKRGEIGSEEDLTCPLCGLPYVYDPSQIGNGKCGLMCPYPKHQSL